MTLKEDETVDGLRTTIVKEVNTWIYVDDLSANEEEADDPMDIDYAWKFDPKEQKNLKIKNNNKNFSKERKFQLISN